MHNIYAPFKITYLSNEQNIENTLYSHGVEKGEQKTNYKFYDYLHLPENIGYMIYNQMGNDPSEPFDEFLEKVFRDLQTSKARGLIIDIRNNGGGNNDYIYHLLPYITDKPFRGDSKMYRKISKEYKSQMRENISSVLKWVTYPPVVWLGAMFSDELKVFTTSEGTLLEFNHETLKYGTTNYNSKVKYAS